MVSSTSFKIISSVLSTYFLHVQFQKHYVINVITQLYIGLILRFENLSAISEYQKQEVVFNLSVSRETKKKQNQQRNYVTLKGEEKCEGRKSNKELQPELVRLVKRLRKQNWKTKRRMSLRQISKHLSELGYLNERGNPYSAQSISDMVKQ